MFFDCLILKKRKVKVFLKKEATILKICTFQNKDTGLYKCCFTILLFVCALISHGQGSFNFYGFNKDYEDVKFQFINNLIVIPLEINQKKLNFILDTGVNKTIVFNASPNDSLLLRNKRRIKLQGLGSGEPVNAVLSKNNRFRIGNLIGNNQTVFIIVKDQFDLSSKMGITIHGVIGHDLLKDVIAQIQYDRKTIRFLNPETYEQSQKCRKCEVLPLILHQNKPYIDVNVLIDKKDEEIPVRMLVDTGGSDALWLFEYSKEKIMTPKNYFDDILGIGLSGTIYGKRSRIASVHIGQFEIEKPTISFLDTISTENARKYKARNGSIGSNILRRFKVWIDYPNKKMTLKRSASLSGGFEYNMSGMDVVYNGKILIREQALTMARDSYGRSFSGNSSINSLSVITNYNYKFKPSFKVKDVVKGSVADLAGVRPDDILLKINSKETYQMTLSEITGKLREKDNKRIRLKIQRDGVVKRIEFRLRRRL